MKFATANAKLSLSIAMAIGLPVAAGTAASADKAPYMMPDGSFITLSGTVVEPGKRAFELDYGDGTVTVEMDDWDNYGEARALMDGDSVTVYGRIDDDFFESTSIEAGAVYVDQLNTYFYASSADEESIGFTPYTWVAPIAPAVSEMTVRGEVVAVDQDDRSFTVAIGDDSVTIETETLGYNPVDDKGYQRVDKGDWVSVSGDLDFELIDGQTLRATRLTTLVDETS
jgi:uncharacterized protein YdeI (BOF family)